MEFRARRATPGHHCLLPTAYCLLPTAYCLLLIPHRFPTARPAYARRRPMKRLALSPETG
ncbi:hypothetical protein FJ471_34515 [Mesorhizobium sp. B2-7-1]|nr:hypothetical protein FJ471_34515 [Mesorhizobium sp. B2-7-1]